MNQGPVPPGQSAKDEDATTAPHAAAHEQEPGRLDEKDPDWRENLGPGRPDDTDLGWPQDRDPSWLDDEEPGWLDEDAPLDPDGDDRDWPGDAAAHAVQAEQDAAEQAVIRDRLLAHGVESGYAHWDGAPVIPGINGGPAGGFGQGGAWDLAGPDPVLAERADYASGTARRFAGVCDDELFGLMGARQRLSSRQAWELLTSIAELIRRRPAPGCAPRGPAAMPRVWAEGTAGELSLQLAITRRDADHLLGLAWDLQVKLPLTSRKLRDGIIDMDKAATAATYSRNLTPEEAMAAERLLFAAPGIEAMTRNQFRDRIARAAMEVNPDAARRHREESAKERRIEVRPEESGNSMIAGRELPPVAVLALDRKLTARARQLKKLGVPGDLNELRVLAFLERWGEADPAGDLARQAAPGGADGDVGQENDGQDGDAGDGGNGGRRPRPGGKNGPGGTNGTGGSGGGCTCGGTGAGHGGGVTGTIHLTAPAATMTEMAPRPGVLRGAGPIDPALTRDLATAAGKNPKTDYHFTITGQDGRPVAHACGKPAPGSRRKPGTPGQPDPPGAGPPTLTRIDRGPPGSYGTWRYTATGGREIIFEFEDLAGPCDHRHQAPGHEPGRHLRHLIGVLNQTCTHPTCRRPEFQCDNEHSRPHDRGGITCLCECGPVCRRNHRDKQQPGWKLEEAGARGWFRWTTPSGRTYLNGPSVYPI